MRFNVSKLHNHLISNHITVKEFADAAGINVDTVERAARTGKAMKSTIRRFASAMGVKPVALIADGDLLDPETVVRARTATSEITGSANSLYYTLTWPSTGVELREAIELIDNSLRAMGLYRDELIETLEQWEAKS